MQHSQVISMSTLVSEESAADERTPALFDYIASAVEDECSNAMDEMQAMLDEMADLNYVSKETGETIYHRMAIHWDLDLMELFYERFMKISETTINISAQDNNGRTPLHEASRVNNTDMIQWLLSHEAKMEERTYREHQSPLHYAARFESIEAMEILLDGGADLEARDYLSRTPLHLAINMGKSVSASYLLSLPTPPEARVKDKDGNMAISDMIHSMPEVALKALDQLHQIDRTHKTESFILAYLEQNEMQEKAIKPPFGTAVLERKQKILVHPVMLTLVNIKWRFVKPYFYIHLLLYLTLLILWSVLVLHPTVQEQHVYKIPQDLWRIIFQIVLLLLFVVLAIEEMVTLVATSIRHINYLKIQLKRKREDLMTLALDEEERSFLRAKIKVVDYIPPYFKDVSHILTNVSNILTLIVIVMYIVNVVAHTSNLATWMARLACCSTVLLWGRLIKFLRAIKFFGSLIAVISAIKTDILRYFILASIFFIPYVICFWVMFGGSQSASLPAGSARKDLSTLFHVAVMTFRMTLVDSYPYEQLRNLDEGMALLLVAPLLLGLAVIGLNLFIALLSYTFQIVQDNAYDYSILELARVINLYEEKLLCRHVINTRYYNYIKTNCNPLVKPYNIMLNDVMLKKQKKPKHESHQETQTILTGLEDKIIVLQQELAKITEILEASVSSVIDSQRRQPQLPSPVASSRPSYHRVRSSTSSSTRQPQTPAEKEWQRKINAVDVEF